LQRLLLVLGLLLILWLLLILRLLLLKLRLLLLILRLLLVLRLLLLKLWLLLVLRLLLILGLLLLKLWLLLLKLWLLLLKLWLLLLKLWLLLILRLLLLKLWLLLVLWRLLLLRLHWRGQVYQPVKDGEVASAALRGSHCGGHGRRDLRHGGGARALEASPALERIEGVRTAGRLGDARRLEGLELIRAEAGAEAGALRGSHWL
jgi:hypothetical protein